ncbi:MAG: hypothetical protein RM049_13720 [Nostoc sp. DedQUE04]|nr:hypothetical protein [Nostoc sp. DedQUE04]MDZ8136345.1 hypothetical protein [Nostoc sp. DedQUE04]
MTKVTSNSRLMYDQSHQLFNGYGALGMGHWALGVLSAELGVRS